MSDNILNNEAMQAAIDLGQLIGEPHTGEAIHYAVVPAGTEIKSLKDMQYPWGLRPDRIFATVTLCDARSFCDYYKLYEDDRSRIFASPDLKRFTAILDYHGVGSDRQAEFLSHKATFQMTLDERWVTWRDRDTKSFTQKEFAEFIEDNNADIIDPSGATMLEVARDLKASMGGIFESKVTPLNGQIQMRYTETVDAKVGAGNILFPEFFKLNIPVFYGEKPVTIAARLRYRISGGALTFHYKLYRHNEILTNSFNDAVAAIATELKTDVLLGSV